MLKAALVTGGSRGLGRELALALGSAGYAVCVNCSTGRDAAEAAVAGAAAGSFAIMADVSDPAAVRGMLDEVASRFGRLDLLVNNAGIGSDALLPRLAEDDWDRTIGVNLMGCANTIRASAGLLARSRGQVINITSRSGLRGSAGQSAYAASKAALVGLTLSAARELAAEGIRVNAVAPGYMPTALGSASPAAMERARRESLLGRLSDPAEAASFVLWLAGTSGITGQVFTLDSRI